MIDFRKHGINYDEYTSFEIKTNDLIALGNIDRNICETKILSDNDTNITIKGEYTLSNVHAVAGGEIVLIKSSSLDSNGNTILNVERELNGTTKDNWTGYNFRTVVVIDEFNKDIVLLEWSFEDTLGSVSNTLFPVELGSGNITLKSDLSLWSPTSSDRKYRVRNRKSIAYIFKGVGDKRFLKFTTVVTKLGVNTRGKNDPNRVKLDIKTKLSTWYDKDLSINKRLKAIKPKEFFIKMFGLEDNDVYYANGVTEESFLKINDLHTKEYKKVSEMLKAFCSNGIRFCFDRFEKVKIFADFKIDNIQSQKTIKYDLTESTLTEDEAMIYNTINTQIVQRQTMYNFSDLGNKYVTFAKVLKNAVMSNEFVGTMDNGDLTTKSIKITNKDVHNHVQIGDLVCFKASEPTSVELEINATVKDKQNGDIVYIIPILDDKDYRLLQLGKLKYLDKILNNNIVPYDLYYVRQELPMVFKFTRKNGDRDKDSALMYPLLPRVNGESLHKDEVNIQFGCASNLKVGSYTGIVEEVDKIFGSWESDKLLYNKEIDQFSNTNYPPIFVLSNKVNERTIVNGEKTTPIINYTTFDNSNLKIDIIEPKDNKSDATIILENTTSINKDIDLFKDSEIGRFGNYIIQVRDITSYKIGDVLILNKPDDLTSQEEIEYDEVLSTIKWTIVAKTTEKSTIDGVVKNYIQLDSPFAKRISKDKVYSFTRYPNTSIVYLQELYIRGNPLIEFKQDISEIARGINIDGDRSVDIYGEKKYEFDSKQLSKDDLKMFLGYILDNFEATNLQTTKFNVPISVYNGIDVELLDVITIIDPNRTLIDERNKWIVVSINNKSKTNVCSMKLLNINSKNTKPFKLNIKDVLEYKPVDIPLYESTGSEGTGGTNDGNGGEGIDKAIGQFNMAEVDAEKFRAKIEKFEDGYIYFKSFAGTEWETYTSKLFPVSEFGITLESETILVQSDSNYRAFIKKRDIYNIEKETIITPEMDVKFLTMTSFTDIDGRFNSRGCHIGDGKSYFAFDITSGAKFVGDFVVGENDKHIGNDLWQSLQKNRTFREDTPPIDTPAYKLREGDMWYDTNDENHVYRYNGDVWISCRDKSIISTKTSTYIQPSEPIATEGRPLREGDTWYDTSRNNTPHVYKDGKWVSVSDTSLVDLINKAKEEADKANEKLADIANDDKLTQSEKQSAKQEWDIIHSEYPKIIEEAIKFGVDKTEYVNLYNNLNNYITPLIANLNIVSDIHGPTFRANFKNYYNARQIILNDISNKIVHINSMQNGKMLYLDPTFKNGLNNTSAYNNSANGLVTLSRMSGESFGIKPPNDSNMVLTITKQEGSVAPYSGGFYFGTPTKSGMKLLTKIVAYIPVGYEIIWASNATGDNSKNYWVTKTDGIGAFQEYVHVLECGTSGTFSSTSFFALKAKDGNDTKSVTWGVSYATVFDSGGNQNEYVTEALGNAKIFRSETAPISGMKLNDMWYDTDDGNHPYIYNGSIWISARDRVFETEGGNKVYFKDVQPPTTGAGVKDGDMWFKTNENNKLFILSNKLWVLADDSLDKINNGRVVINANTTFNGDATIVSQGTNEQTIIKGGNITFTRDGIPITTFRNMKMGVIETDGNGRYITFDKFNACDVLVSISAFNIGNNIRSLNAGATLTDPLKNTWKLYIYGTEGVVGNPSSGSLNFGGTSVSFPLTYRKLVFNSLKFRLGYPNVMWDYDTESSTVAGTASFNVHGNIFLEVEVVQSNSLGTSVVGYYEGRIPIFPTGYTAGSRLQVKVNYQDINIPITVNTEVEKLEQSNISIKLKRATITIGGTVTYWGSVTRSISGSANAIQNGNNNLTYTYYQELVTAIQGSGAIQYLVIER